jgi:hypothetical protein
MNTNLDPADFDSLRAYVVSLFPGKPAGSATTQQEQDDELRLLSRTIGSERFYFVVDLPSFEIVISDGIQRWLGYYEKDFTLKRYWKLVHPGLQKSVHTIFLQLCEVLCRGKFELKFMVQRYSSLIALKHAAGHYVLAKRTASVFQYDVGNRLTQYLNEFTIIGEYNGEALSPSFFTDKGEVEKERGQIIMQKAIEQFLGMKVFSANELQVARLLAYQPGITQGEIAALMNLSVHTVDTYYKRFLKKSREFFVIEFASVSEAAKYLRNSGLL